PKATEEEPRWVVVDLEFVTEFDQPITRDQLKEEEALEDMLVLQRGQRLSVMPVEERHWKHICEMAGVDP
ncbi:MAG: EVE domain-containing protein, partial [Acidobacteriota bacterium]|nr:EVE domain-containing protein [Acidobacteriota bacterium]